jgi:hypothetical protein
MCYFKALIGDLVINAKQYKIDKKLNIYCNKLNLNYGFYRKFGVFKR